MDLLIEDIIKLVQADLTDAQLRQALALKECTVPPRTHQEQQQLALPQPPAPTNGHAESVTSVINELISREEYDTAPIGHVWWVPVSRLANAVRYSRHERRRRPNGYCRAAVGKVFEARGQPVALSCPAKAKLLRIVKIEKKEVPQ